jgi:hypothetical protein
MKKVISVYSRDMAVSHHNCQCLTLSKVPCFVWIFLGGSDRMAAERIA